MRNFQPARQKSVNVGQRCTIVRKGTRTACVTAPEIYEGPTRRDSSCRRMMPLIPRSDIRRANKICDHSALLSSVPDSDGVNNRQLLGAGGSNQESLLCNCLAYCTGSTTNCMYLAHPLASPPDLNATANGEADLSAVIHTVHTTLGISLGCSAYRPSDLAPIDTDPEFGDEQTLFRVRF